MQERTSTKTSHDLIISLRHFLGAGIVGTLNSGHLTALRPVLSELQSLQL